MPNWNVFEQETPGKGEGPPAGTPPLPTHEGEPTGEQPKEGQPPAEPAPTFSFGEPPPAPSGQEWDPLALKAFDAAVQDLGATPEDARAVLAQYAGWKEPANEIEYNAAKDAAVATLRKEWGPQFDEKLEAAVRAASRLSPTLLAELDRTGLGNSPDLIRRFAAIGETMGSAQDQINAVLGNRAHPYHHPMHPEHEKAVKDLQKLYAKVYGSRPVSGGGVR